MRRRGEPYLVPPGARRNNPHYIIRGNFDGKIDKEESTWTENETAARSMLATVIYNEKLGIRSREIKTFQYAVDQFTEAKQPSDRTKEFLRVLCTFWGPKRVGEVEEEIMAVANRLYPMAKASTKNRAVLVPAYAVLNWAAKKPRRWCDKPEMEKFEESPVKKRATSIEDAIKLVNALDGIQRLAVLWLYKHTDRVTSTIEVEGQNIHLDGDYYDRLTGKKKKYWQKAPLDPEVKEQLISVFGDKLPVGKIFPWNGRWAVYRWLKPLCKRLKVKFTPHVARHSMLSWIGNAGGSSIQIKTRAGHASLHSSEPYLAENLKTVRDITAQFVLVNKKASPIESRVKSRGTTSRKGKKHA